MAKSETKIVDHEPKAKSGWRVLLTDYPFQGVSGQAETIRAGTVVKLDASDVEAFGVQTREATEDDISIGGALNRDLTVKAKPA